MTDLSVLSVVLAAAGGAVVGLMFFGTLWWTVRRLTTARHPGLLVAGSFLLRAVVAAVGIVIVSRGELVPLLLAIGGFIAARTALIRVVGRPLDQAAGSGSTPVPAKDAGPVP